MKRVRNMSTELSSWVQAQSGLGPAIGDVYFGVPTNSSTVQFMRWLQANGVDESHYTTSLPALYTAATAGRNDTVILCQGNYALTEELSWSKQFTHLIGGGAKCMVAQRARITCSTAADVTPMVHVTGQGCKFENLMFSNDGNDTGNLIVVQVDSQSNEFNYCYFANGHATNAIAGAAALALGGSTLSLYNMFDHCTIGSSNTLCSSTYSALLFNGTNAKSSNFLNCNFTLQAGATTVAFVRSASGTANDTYMKFDNCFFHNTNSGSYMIASAFVIAAGQDPATRTFYLMPNCMLFGATDWDSGNTSCIKTTLGTFTAGGNSGIAAVTSAT
jgi:hypothetical protein